MISLLLLMAAKWPALAQLAPSHSKGYFQSVFPHPTGMNALEDYLRAADMLRDESFSIYFNWKPTQYQELLATPAYEDSKEFPLDASDKAEATATHMRRLAIAKELSDLDYLGVQELLARRYGGAIKLLVSGNQKPYFDPRSQGPDAMDFPELSAFRTVAKFIVSDSYQKLANGDTTGAQGDLSTGLIFAQRIGRSTTISGLVSVSCQAILIAPLEEHFGRFGVSNLSAMNNVAQAILKEPFPMISCLEGDRKRVLSTLSELSSEENIKGLVSTGDGEDKAADAQAKLWKSMSVAQRQQFVRDLIAQVSKGFDKSIARFNGPESTWIPPVEPDEGPVDPKQAVTIDQMRDELAQTFIPVLRQATISMLRNRVQLRLISIHAQVLQYRWRNHQLPSDLSQAVPAYLIQDPFSGKPFHYESADGINYVLYSEGIPETGKIELKYRKPKVGSGQSSPP